MVCRIGMTACERAQSEVQREHDSALSEHAVLSAYGRYVLGLTAVPFKYTS